MGAGESAWWTLTPYALAGLLMGPLSGRLAAMYGYRRVLRIGMVGAVISIGVMLLVVGGHSRVLLLVASILTGLTYAGTGNIILNGLGIVLSPKENRGFLPGLNAGAFNLGAGLSFAVIFAVKTVLSPADGSGTAGYRGALLAGLIILAVALATSFLIPKPVEAEAPTAAGRVPVGH
jgi:MFS family permease